MKADFICSMLQPGRLHQYAAAILVAAALATSGCVVHTPALPPVTTPAVPVPQATTATIESGALYNSRTHRPLFESRHARQPGDIITVVLDERTAASKSASTSTNKNSSVSLPTPELFGGTPSFRGKSFLSAAIQSDHGFAGAADSTQSNQLLGEISVTVTAVLPNGNLLVEGEKYLTLNQGNEIIRIAGLVRAADITPRNTVLSTRLANARITYSGSGPLADSNTQGWLTRLLGSPLWPF